MGKVVLTPFAKLKKRIFREFPKVKFIGDIIISDEEYGLLMSYLNNTYKGIRSGSIISPVDPLFTVSLVQIGIKHYDGNYWGHVAREVGLKALPGTHQMQVGMGFYKTLQKYDHFNLGPGDRVKNILMHGFVCNNYANDFFNFLFAFYRIDLERDLSRFSKTMMNDLIEVMTRNDNTGRTYWIVQQTADAIRANPKGSKIRIRRLLRLMDRAFWEQIVPINPINRISKYFVDWKENSREFNLEYNKYHGKYIGGGQKSFSSPYLKCDFQKTTFKVYLPAQIVKSDDTDNVYWSISWAGKDKTLKTQLYQGVTGYKTEELSIDIPAGELFQEISLELMVDQTRLRRFKIPADCIRFFDKEGDSNSTDALPSGEAYAFTPAGELVVSEAVVDVEERGHLILTYFDFQHGDILRLPDGKPLSVGKRLDEGLLLRGRKPGIYALNREGEEVPVYRKEPTILLKILPSRAAGTIISINNQRHRLFDEQATVIDLEDRSGEKGYIIRLSNYCSQEGLYQVLIDVPNDKSSRSWEFAFIQDFDFTFEDAPYIFTPRGTLRFPDSFSLFPDEHSEKVVGENAFNFKIDPILDYTHLTLHSSPVKIPLRVYVPVFKWKFANDPWQIEKPSRIWHKDFPTFISLKYPDDTITINMDDADNDVADQSVKFTKLKEKHLFKCDMTRFKSWFGRDKEIRTLYLDFPNNRQEFLDVVTRSMARSCLIRGDFNKGLLICEIDIVGERSYCVDIKCNGQLLADKVPLVYGRLELPTSLASGEYTITLYEEDEDDSGFGGVDYLLMGEYTQELLNPGNLKGKSILVENIRSEGARFFYQSLSCRYVVRGLRKFNPTDSHNYRGRMYVEGFNEKILATMEVKVEFPDLEKLNVAKITFWEDHEYLEFLYDTRRKIIVKHEDKNLHRTERYRRYTVLYPEDYEFVVSFLSATEVFQDQNHRRVGA